MAIKIPMSITRIQIPVRLTMVVKFSSVKWIIKYWKKPPRTPPFLTEVLPDLPFDRQVVLVHSFQHGKSTDCKRKSSPLKRLSLKRFSGGGSCLRASSLYFSTSFTASSLLRLSSSVNSMLSNSWPTSGSVKLATNTTQRRSKVNMGSWVKTSYAWAWGMSGKGNRKTKCKVHERGMG